MKEINFLYSLSPDLENRLRVSAFKEKGEILGFVVQYEIFIQDKWYPVARYDTAHGFAHKDVIHFDGETEKEFLYLPDFNIAFTFAIQNIKTSWRWYRSGFEKEVNEWKKKRL